MWTNRSGLIATAIAINAAAAIPWWIGLAISPAFRRWFVPATTPDAALLAFACADALLFTGAGVVQPTDSAASAIGRRICC